MDIDRVWRLLDVIGCNLMSRYFVGGDSVEKVLERGKNLKRQGYNVTYNLLGEHLSDFSKTRMALETTLDLMGAMNDSNSGNISCKPTLYGLDLSPKIFKDIFKDIVDYAIERHIEVEVDAENYDFVEQTFNTCNEIALISNYEKSIRFAVQAHLLSICDLMTKYKIWDRKVRIVKGSGVYQESDNLIEKDASGVEEKYLEIFRRSFGANNMPFVATMRDGDLAEKIIEIVGNNKKYFEFQFLYGPLGRGLRAELLKRGYTVRIYIPFVAPWCKDEWRPYGLRRAQLIRKLFWHEIRGAVENGW
jgi:proline dehydrogenase